MKHYLTSDGIAYFQSEWFPKVYSIISKQPGFISILHSITGASANISLKFRDSATFQAWLDFPEHDSLVNALDDYRDRDYWEVVQIDTEDEAVEPSELEWMKITLNKAVKDK